MKVRMVLSCEVVRYNEDDSVQLQDAFFHYEVIENLRSTDESHVFDVVMQTFDARIQNFNKRGSNCRFQRVISLDIYLAEFRPLNGSSYIKLPEFIKSKKAVLNVKNADNRCFKWCITRAPNPFEKNPQRTLGQETERTKN